MLLGFTDVRNPVLVIKDIRLRAPGEAVGAHFRNMRLNYVRLISRRCIFLQFPPHVTNPQHDRGPLSISQQSLLTDNIKDIQSISVPSPHLHRFTVIAVLTR